MAAMVDRMVSRHWAGVAGVVACLLGACGAPDPVRRPFLDPTNNLTLSVDPALRYAGIRDVAALISVSSGCQTHGTEVRVFTDPAKLRELGANGAYSYSEGSIRMVQVEGTGGSHIFLHELGHAYGLAHSEDPDSFMARDITAHMSDDIAHAAAQFVAQVGALPCITVVMAGSQ